MIKRWLALVCALVCCLSPALARELTPEEILERMAEPAPQGLDDLSGYLVMPEDFDMPQEEVYRLLLIGADSYSDKYRGRSDTILYVQLGVESKTVKLVSFLRDTYVKIPGRGSNRINASYAYGGASLLRKTLQTNFGLEADAYVAVNFQGLTNVLDAIGGVEVELSEAEVRYANSILRFYNEKIGFPAEDQLIPQAGLQRLTGKQAMCYARIRKLDGDFQRTQRQRKVVEAAFRQVMTLDMAGLANLLEQGMALVDTDLSLADALRLIPLAIRSRNAVFSSLHIPAAGLYASRMVDGMAVLVPNLKKNVRKISDFLYEP